VACHFDSAAFLRENDLGQIKVVRLRLGRPQIWIAAHVACIDCVSRKQNGQSMNLPQVEMDDKETPRTLPDVEVTSEKEPHETLADVESVDKQPPEAVADLDIADRALTPEADPESGVLHGIKLILVFAGLMLTLFLIALGLSALAFDLHLRP
jgi:hypothetical protein